jgi:superfamily II RNA helicase
MIMQNTSVCSFLMILTHDVNFRTTVLASLSKRGDTGHQLLSANSMLQMAGRAGRRGIDEQGHTVVVQTPFEGAEDCCKLLFAGSDPLVSQFTATYGMALNLLAVSAFF